MVFRKLLESSEPLTQEEQLVLGEFKRSSYKLRVELTTSLGLIPSKTNRAIDSLNKKGYIEIENQVPEEIGAYDRIQLTRIGLVLVRKISEIVSKLQRCQIDSFKDQNNTIQDLASKNNQEIQEIANKTIQEIQGIANKSNRALQDLLIEQLEKERKESIEIQSMLIARLQEAHNELSNMPKSSQNKAKRSEIEFEQENKRQKIE